MKKIRLYIYGIYYILLFSFIFVQPIMGRAEAVQSLVKEYIYYTRLTDGYWQIWVYERDSGQSRQLTFSKKDKKTPFSCASKESVIYRTAEGTLESYKIQTQETEELCPDIEYIADAKCIGGKLLFTRYRTDAKDDSDIWRVDIETGEREVITQEAVLQYHPEISSDGKYLFYVSGTVPDEHHIYRKDLRGGKREQMTFERGYQAGPRVSPNCREVVYVSNASGDYEIWKMDINGKKQKMLTQEQGLDHYPCWSPDGEEIVYASYKDKRYQLMRMDRNGRNKQVLIETEASCSEPHWVRIEEQGDE